MSSTNSNSNKPGKSGGPSVLPQTLPPRSPMKNPGESSNNTPALKNQAGQVAIPSERSVSALPAEYSDLLKPKEPAFDFKKQILPVGAILAVSLVLAFLFNLKQAPQTPQTRGVSGQLNDLSNGQYSQQSADYETEKTCVDHPDGTQSCTTKTKLKRSFR